MMRIPPSGSLPARVAALLACALLLFACEEVYGPDRTVAFENGTSVVQTFSLDVNGEDDERIVTLQPSQTVRVSFTGTYTKSELPLPYLWRTAGGDRWRIVEAPSENTAITNALPFEITLRDAKIDGFSCTVPANGSKEERVHRTAHDFYIDGGREVGGAKFIDHAGATYQYKVTVMDGGGVLVARDGAT